MSIRDYGRVNSEVEGIPEATPASQEVRDNGCPNCGCSALHEIGVDVKNNLLRGGKGRGKYLGCPACPWASEMVMISTGAE